MQTTGEIAEAEPISKRRGDNDVAEIVSGYSFTWHPVQTIKLPSLSRSPFTRRLIVSLLAFLILTPLILLLFRPGTTEAAWYSNSWRFRKILTIDRSKVPSTQTNFPVLVSITDVSLKAHAQGNGNDILFTSSDGTTKLSHEIESFATGSGKLVAWVEIPSLSSSANTQIYMYYGNPTVSTQQDAPGTWSNGYKVVWPFKEGSGSTVADSTGLAHTGTFQTGATWQPGSQIGNGMYNSSTLGVSTADSTDFDNTTTLTAAVWVKFASVDDYKRILGKYEFIAADAGSWQIMLDNADHAVFNVNNGSTWAFLASSNTLSANKWHYIVATYDGTNARIYVDGVVTSTGHAGTIPNSAYCLRVGFSADTTAGCTTTPDTGDEGIATYDQVYVTNTVVRSQDWITTEYNNQSSPSTFLSVGLQVENKGAPVAWYKFDEGQGTVANNAGTCGTSCNGTLTNMSSPAASGSGWTTSAKFGKALAFDGANDYVEVADNPILDPSIVSFSAWIKPSSLPGASADGIISHGNDSAGWYVEYRSNRNMFFCTTACIQGSNGIINEDVWQHITITHDGTNDKFYINGVLTDTMADTNAITNYSRFAQIWNGFENCAKVSSSLEITIRHKAMAGPPLDQVCEGIRRVPAAESESHDRPPDLDDGTCR